MQVGGSQINARALGTSVSACTVEDNNNGSYTVAFTSYVVDTGRVIVRNTREIGSKKQEE